MRYEPAPLPIRLPKRGEKGESFIRWLHRTAGRERAKRLAILLQQWDITSDELQRPPSPKEYAEAWGEPLSSAYRAFEEFRAVFPSESDPARVVGLLWDAMPRGPGELKPWLDAEIVPL